MRLVVCAALMASVSQVAMAAVPTIVDPGVQQKQFEQRSAPRAVREPLVQAPAEAAAVAQDAHKVFVLQQVRIQSATVYSEAELQGLAQEFIGRKVSFGDLNAIAQAITARYRNDGYILSHAVLVPQAIDNGTVTIAVSEGYISHVQINGDLPDSRGLVQSYVEKIKAARPINAKTLERYLLLMDDLPGATAKSVIKASATDKNGSDLIINIAQEKVEGALAVDNRGSRPFGRYRGMATAALNSALGIYDRTTVRGLVTAETDEMKFGEITHEEQLGTEGLRLTGRAFMVDTHAGGRTSTLDIEGDTKGMEVGLLYPLLRSRQTNFNLMTQLGAINSDVDLLGTQLSDDHIRSIMIGAQYDFADSVGGVNLVKLTGEHGLDILGATDEGAGRSRINGAQEYNLMSFEASRVQQISGPWSVLLGTAGQYAGDALLASKEFALGGSEFGRGYDGGELTGDHGLAYNAELRYSGAGTYQWLDSYQYYLFLDGGKIWNRDRVLGDVASDSLTSTGIGGRFNFAQNWSGSAELALPVNKRIAAEGGAGDDSRIFFNAVKRF